MQFSQAVSKKDYQTIKDSGQEEEFYKYLWDELNSCALEQGLEFPQRAFFRMHAKIGKHLPEALFGKWGAVKSWFLERKANPSLPFSPDLGETLEIEDWWEESHILEEGKRYIITAACGGGVARSEHLASVDTYRKLWNASLVVLPMRGVTKDDVVIDPKLQEMADYIGGEIEFNSNLRAMDFRLHPAQMIGTTGLKRFGQKDFSLIVAHTKQAAEAVPVAVGSFPHLIYTTGCITKQHYNSTRTGRIAEQDETYGGLIVEVVDENIFHIREFQFDSEGGFADLGVYYSGEGTREIGCVMVFGDVHVGDTDEYALAAAKDQINFLNPRKAFLHDLFNGRSINHHVEKSITKQTIIRQETGTLKDELDITVTFLRELAEQYPKTEFNVVASNHNEWLDQWLEQGLYTKSPENHQIGLLLAPTILRGENPLEEYYKMSFALGEPRPSNVRFLRRTDSVKHCGFELALHGDRSHSGRFGSVYALEESFGRCIVGHLHTMKILRGIRIVGTMTRLNLDYTAGYGSSWLHTNCVLYDNGKTQMLTAINGKWRASF